MLKTKHVVEMNTEIEGVKRDVVVEAVAVYNNGFSFIFVDDGCYIIVNGNQISSWIDAAALEELKKLPAKPKDCYPAKEEACTSMPETVVQQGLGVQGTMQ